MTLDPYLQKQVELGMDGADIMHGYLKNLMLECETELIGLSEIQDSPVWKYYSGRMDTLTELYALTYEIAFTKGELNAGV